MLNFMIGLIKLNTERVDNLLFLIQLRLISDSLFSKLFS